MKKRINYVSLALILILAVALVFTPTRIVHAGSTVEQIEEVTIEWIINETNSKKAIVHVIASEGNYDFLMEGNVEQVGSETDINLDGYLLLENGTQIYAQSAVTSVFDIVYDAPFAPGTAVETVYIGLSSAEAVAVAIAGVLLAVVFIVIVEAILNMLGLPMSANLALLVASIPWVYLTIYHADHNPDSSLDLYIPYTYTQPPGKLYVATAFSWWLIAKAGWWIFTWYTATWVGTRPEMPTAPPQPPSASFSWSPDTVYPSEEVTFVSTSFDPDGEIQNWHWWFGDDSEAYGETVTHIYSQPGFYNVRLDVTDNDDLTDETSTSIMGIPFQVIPETPLGTITVILVMIGALGLFMVIHHPKKVNSKFKRLV